MTDLLPAPQWRCRGEAMPACWRRERRNEVILGLAKWWWSSLNCWVLTIKNGDLLIFTVTNGYSEGNIMGTISLNYHQTAWWFETFKQHFPHELGWWSNLTIPIGWKVPSLLVKFHIVGFNIVRWIHILAIYGLPNTSVDNRVDHQIRLFELEQRSMVIHGCPKFGDLSQ